MASTFGDLGSADYVRDIEITFTAAWRADTNRFIRKRTCNELRSASELHGYRGDSQLLTGTNEPAGQFRRD